MARKTNKPKLNKQPKRKKYYVSYKEQRRRKLISEGLLRYWRNVKQAATEYRTQPKAIQKKFKRARDINAEGLHKYLHSKNLKGGKKKKYSIAITARDTKGEVYRTTIRGIGGRNSKALKMELERLSKVWLRANGLVMKKYFVRFARNKYIKHLRSFKLLIKGV